MVFTIRNVLFSRMVQCSNTSQHSTLSCSIASKSLSRNVCRSSISKRVDSLMSRFVDVDLGSQVILFECVLKLHNYFSIKCSCDFTRQENNRHFSQKRNTTRWKVFHILFHDLFDCHCHISCQKTRNRKYCLYSMTMNRKCKIVCL